jgi:pimeloyl-ACP methyl ester carboxylesterase
MSPRAITTVTALAIFCLTCVSVSTSKPSSAPEETYTYVIVHGAWGGGWAFKHLDSLLTAKGHEVYRPTLTGCGDRVHLARPDIDVSTHIEDIVQTIVYEDLDDVVLVAHSYGGMVATGVAHRVPERLRCVIYFDAFLPEDGESLITSSRGHKGEAFRKMLVASAKDGLIAAPGPPDEVGVTTSGFDRRTPQPVRTLTETLTLDNPAAAALPTKYILTVEAGVEEADDSFAPYAARARARDWPVAIMEGGHVPVGAQWEELARLLADLPE